MQPPTSLEVQLLAVSAGYADDLQTLHASIAAGRERYRVLRPHGPKDETVLNVEEALGRGDIEVLAVRIADLEIDLLRAERWGEEHCEARAKALEELDTVKADRERLLDLWRSILLDAVGVHFPNCSLGAECRCALRSLYDVTHVIRAHAETLRAQRADFEAMASAARNASQGVSVAALPGVTIDPPEISGIPEGMAVFDPGEWGRAPRNDEEADHGPTGLWLRHLRPGFGPEIVHGGFIRTVNMRAMFVYRVAGKLWADPVTMADDLRWERIIPAPQPG